jgi:8-oxo-dGTP diphosphatase
MAFTQLIYLAADTILIAEEHVLLIKRKNEPFKGMWAFPGGFVDEGEDLPNAAARELLEETSVAINPERLTQFKTYGKPGRDPRFHTVSVVYAVHVNKKPEAIAADDAAEVAWFSLTKLPKMAFDHSAILEEYLLF